MASPSALSSYSSCRCLIVQLMYADLRACLYRLRSLLAAAVAPVPVPLSDLTARRLRHVRIFVDVLSDASHSNQGPLLTPEMRSACTEALDEIEEILKQDPAAACQRAIRVVEAIGVSVPCLTYI
jgi:hypothetical protein